MRLEQILQAVSKEIEKSQLSITKIEKESLDLVLKTYDNHIETVFYYNSRLHRADKYETKFKLMERILNAIKLNEKVLEGITYLDALKSAVNKIVEFGLDCHENRIENFVQVFILQSKNIENDNIQQYFALLLHCAIHCLAMANKPLNAIKVSEDQSKKVGGIDASYDKFQNWPLHVMVFDAKEALKRLINFFIGYLETKYHRDSRPTTEIVQEFVSSVLTSEYHGNPHLIISEIAEKWNAERKQKPVTQPALTATVTTTPGAANNPIVTKMDDHKQIKPSPFDAAPVLVHQYVQNKPIQSKPIQVSISPDLMDIDASTSIKIKFHNLLRLIVKTPVST